MKARYGRQSVRGRENMSKLSNDTLLSITYGDLKGMLVDFQMDGLNADGCSCSLHLDEDEKTALYNAAGKQKKSIPPDLPEYIMEHEYVSAALRTARDLDAGEEEWQRFIDDLRRRKG